MQLRNSVRWEREEWQEMHPCRGRTHDGLSPRHSPGTPAESRGAYRHRDVSQVKPVQNWIKILEKLKYGNLKPTPGQQWSLRGSFHLTISDSAMASDLERNENSFCCCYPCFSPILKRTAKTKVIVSFSPKQLHSLTYLIACSQALCRELSPGGSLRPSCHTCWRSHHRLAPKKKLLVSVTLMWELNKKKWEIPLKSKCITLPPWQ